MTSTRRTPIAERFFAKVEITETCWLWTASTDKAGYGAICRGGREGMARAHRVAYELMVGPIPEGLVLDHLCRVKACVNPDHLEAVTPQVNFNRGVYGKGKPRKTHCKYGHELTPENTVSRGRDDGGRRRCRTCHHRNTARYRQRLKETAS